MRSYWDLTYVKNTNMLSIMLQTVSARKLIWNVYPSKNYITAIGTKVQLKNWFYDFEYAGTANLFVYSKTLLLRITSNTLKRVPDIEAIKQCFSAWVYVLLLSRKEK